MSGFGPRPVRKSASEQLDSSKNHDLTCKIQFFRFGIHFASLRFQPRLRLVRFGFSRSHEDRQNWKRQFKKQPCVLSPSTSRTEITRRMSYVSNSNGHANRHRIDGISIFRRPKFGAKGPQLRALATGGVGGET